MPETRVIDIAKSQGMSTADVLMRLRDAGFDVTAAASMVDEGSALAALAANGTSGSTRVAAPAAPRPAAAQPAPRAPQPQQRPAQPPEGAASNRRVFEPDGPPLQMRGRREEEPYAQQPMPRPTGPRPAAEPAARGGGSGAGQGGAGRVSRTGSTTLQAAKVEPAPPPPPPLRRAAPAAPAAPTARQAPARQPAPSRRPAAPSGPPLPKPSSEPARRRSEQIAAARAAEGPQAQQPAAEAQPAGESETDEKAAARAARGPKIIAQPEPPKRPTRDETKSQPQARGGRPGAAPGGPGGRRRVVIDSQASRRGPGGPGGPGGGPPMGGGPPKRRGKSRGRRRREVLEEVATPLAEDIMTRTDLVRINSGSTVKDVAEYLGVPVPEIIKKLMGMGEMVTLTQTLSDEAIGVLAEEFNRKIEIVSASDDADDEVEYDDDEVDLVERPPVVTIMGHVDHGKTSLLDAIRSTEVASGEAGGITQHIGAYQVHHNDKTITFLDTPGHEAFTAMRARGGQVSDISVVVVAADDGVMPQTREAVDHSRAADVPILVAVNKVDKEGADPTRVRTELTQLDLQPSEWGGETEYVDVSAKTRQGLEDLLDTILVVAELEELSANPETEASGVVIESKLDPGRGPVVTMLVQRGTLHVGDALVGGEHWGKVRAMVDYKGDRVQQAVPGDPVEVLGFDGVPDAGDFVRVVENDRTARQLANERAVRVRNEMQARRSGRKTSFDDLFKGIQGGEVKELDLVLKADVSGSLEAFEDEIARLPQDEVAVNVIHSGVGGINESDVMLATASDAVILGFNVRPVGDARQAAEREGVEVRTYSVIYQALDDLRDAMTGMLEPEQVEETIGTVEVRAIFKASRVGTIAGCYVTDGVVRRGSKVRVVRDGTVIYDTTIDSLKRFNDDAREVASGYECGVVLANYPDVKEGDVLEAYEIRSVERALS